MWDTFVAGAGLLLTAVGLFAGWATTRRNELRKNDVLSWVNAAIACFETIALYSHPNWFPTQEDELNKLMREEAVKTSILIEQGRMFFKNKAASHGGEKEPAYRGYRPLILDELVILHGVGRNWPTLTVRQRELAHDISVESLKRFVSLAQSEVGRDRTASTDTEKPGDGVDFETLLFALENQIAVPRPSIDDTKAHTQFMRFLRFH